VNISLISLTTLPGATTQCWVRRMTGFVFRIVSCGLIIATTSAAAQNQGDATGEWTLDRLIAYALENNKQLEATRLAKNVSEQSVSFAQSQRRPRLDAVALLNAYPSNERLLIERHGFRPASNPFEDAILKYGLQMTFPLYTGGRIRQEINLAESGVEASLARIKLTRQELIFNVTSAYFAYLQLQSVLEANGALLRSVTESRRIVAQKLAVGRTSQLDLLKLDARVSAAQTRSTVVRNAVGRSLATLTALLALPPGTPINIVGELKMAETSMSYEEARNTALAERQDLIALRAEIEAQNHRVEIAGSRFRPQLNSSVFVGGYTGDSGETQGDVKISIDLRFPLYSGNALQAKQRESLIRLEELKARLADAARSAMAEVDLAMIELDSTKARLNTGLLAVELAQEALRIERRIRARPEYRKRPAFSRRISASSQNRVCGCTVR